jgi:hypothetical protein
MVIVNFSRPLLWNHDYDLQYDIHLLQLEWLKYRSSSASSVPFNELPLKRSSKKSSNRGMNDGSSTIHEDRGENLIYLSVGTSENSEENDKIHFQIMEKVISSFNLSEPSLSSPLLSSPLLSLCCNRVSSVCWSWRM